VGEKKAHVGTVMDVDEQVARVATRYPDVLVLSRPDSSLKYGGFTLFYTVNLPKGKFNMERTWIAWDVPPGFPASQPRNFYCDPNLRMSYGGFIRKNSWYLHPLLGAGNLKGGLIHESPVNAQIVHGYVQMWNPNHSSLFTYAMVIKHALEYSIR
jgi:hypothetical protein